MAIIKCKMCGGDIELSSDKTFGTCEFCGSTMTFPKIEEEQRVVAFNRGNHFRRIGDFDKALLVYEHIVQEDDTDAEAHWCCALCRFGIEYVEDPATYEWIPTCHRASFDSFLEDVDYQAAIEYSDGITRRQYQKDAMKIAEVQKSILVTSQKEEPYDVFLCYKESDEQGNRTKDSVLAQEIYYQLLEQGHRVFFSRITLEDKVGTQYEPYIFAALHSAKVMIVVGTREEYLNSVWVKNEWSRFLAMMKKDHLKALVPCYCEMNPYDLPQALSVLQAYDMGKLGFMQDLLRGINKILNHNVATKEEVLQVSKDSTSFENRNYDSMVAMGFMDFELGKKETAADTFRQVLLQDDSYVEAYLGMILVSETEERIAYGEKFSQYASKQMSSLEKKIFTKKTQQELLKTYCWLQDLQRVKEAVSIFQGDVPKELFEELIIQWPNVEMIRVFLEQGSDINVIMEQEHTDGISTMPMLSHLIWKKVPIEVIRAVLECGANPNSKREFIGKKDGCKKCLSVLNDVIIYLNNVEYVQLLLEYGANPDSHRSYTNQYGVNYYSVLNDSVWNAKNVKIAEILLNHGADINFVDKEYFNDGHYEEKTMLHDAILHNGDLEMIKLLLEHGANPNIERLHRKKQGDSIYSALYDSEWKMKSKEAVELLLEHGANVNFQAKIYYDDGTYAEKTTLHDAVLNGNLDIIRVLLEHGANPNIERLYRKKQGDNIYSVLYDSEWKMRSKEAVELLLKYGAEIDFQAKIYNNDGTYEEKTTLHEAILCNESLDIIKLLLEQGADANIKRLYRNNNGDSYYSILGDNINKYFGKHVEVLLQHGASASSVDEVMINELQKEKYCMLHYAVSSLCYDLEKIEQVLTLLITYGASIKGIVTYEGRDITFKKYPYDVKFKYSGEKVKVLKVLKKIGWKGPGIFGV